jgi:hypothetical protein
MGDLLHSESERVLSSRTEDEGGGLSPRSASVRRSTQTLKVVTDIDKAPCLIPSSMSSPNRARNFKAQFIEVYVGAQVFEAAVLNVVIAIYLQASDRLYEVVLINQDTAEEIDRLYVYENELSDQMDIRLTSLTTLCEARVVQTQQKTHKSHVTPSKKGLGGTAAPDLPSIVGDKSSPDKQKLCIAPVTRRDVGPVGASSPHDAFMDIKCQRNDELKDEELSKIININSNHDSPIMTTAPRVAKPMSYFNLMSGSHIHPAVGEHGKVSKQDVLCDAALRERDISAAAVKDISFFTAVILHSVYVRRKAQKGNTREFQFVLFDGV